MTHWWLHHVKAAFEVTQTCCITNATFAVQRWPLLLSSQVLSCLLYLCQTPELFVMDDFVIKWERCWVSDRSFRSTWPFVIHFSFLTYTRANSICILCTSSQSVRLPVWIRRTRIRTSIQATHGSKEIVSTITIFPLLASLFSFLPNLAHTRCFTLPCVKLAP